MRWRGTRGRRPSWRSAGSAAGSTRVGGYLGFAQTLDTALRGQLSGQLVMQVRANVPSYWVGETFDTWQGESWAQSDTRTRTVQQTQPIVLPPSVGSTLAGAPDLQTFYLSGTTANLVFHAESASELWFPASKVFVSGDGTIVSPLGLGTGAIYTVESDVDVPTPAQLRADDGPQTLPPTTLRDDLQLPHAYPRVAALAASITAHDATTYDKIAALIAWMGRHTRYSTDIPPLPAGADSVDEFLFGNRVGFCEQISTSLAVMLRSLGIVTREAVGYVPGGYDPITDLYQVHANDAHAWVQVWFPGYGWQNFDPTAAVPAVAPSPGATALRDVAGALGASRGCPSPPSRSASGRSPRPSTGAGAARCPGTRASRTTPSAPGGERGGPAGPPRRCPSTPAPSTRRRGRRARRGPAWRGEVEASAYGGRVTTGTVQRDLLTTARRTRVRRRNRKRAGAAVGS